MLDNNIKMLSKDNEIIKKKLEGLEFNSYMLDLCFGISILFK